MLPPLPPTRSRRQSETFAAQEKVKVAPLDVLSSGGATPTNVRGDLRSTSHCTSAYDDDDNDDGEGVEGEEGVDVGVGDDAASS